MAAANTCQIHLHASSPDLVAGMQWSSSAQSWLQHQPRKISSSNQAFGTGCQFSPKRKHRPVQQCPAGKVRYASIATFTLSPHTQAGTEPAKQQQQQQSALEVELRRARRREEKLQALVYRLREDSASPTAFDTLRDVRGLEYELDFVTNRAQRESQVSGADTKPLLCVLMTKSRMGLAYIG